MKKKRGFTLIELLAVIVVLAIIALIAMPLIMNVVDEAKKGAIKNSALEYVRTIETNAATTMMENTPIKLNGKYNVCGDYLCDVSGNQVLEVQLKGSKPQVGSYVMLVKNQVVGGKLTIDGFDVGLAENSKEYELGEEGSIPTLYLDGEVVYFNPVSNELCSLKTYETDGGTTSEKKTGCMKWYAFNDTEDSTTVNLLLDHNTTNKITVPLCNISGLLTINNKLTSDASGWHADVKSTARMLKIEEVLKIVGNENFDTETVSKEQNAGNGNFYFDTLTTENPGLKQGESKYAWLFNNTNSCTNYGCDYSMSGPISYALSPMTRAFNTNLVWYVSNEGKLDSGAWIAKVFCATDNASSATIDAGLRPVITITK